MTTSVVQKGTAFKVGFAGKVYTGYSMEGVKIEPQAQVDVIKGEDSETITKIISDPAEKITFSALIKSTGSLTPPIIGAAISIDSVSYMVEASSVSYERGISKLDVTGIKETSMTYT